jgi:hypothetical protein
MKLPRFLSHNGFDAKPKQQDEQVFAEASELARLRLEQCIADQKIPRPHADADRTSRLVTNRC